ncbi:transglutaminase TgpA family protein [Protaetiibacter intestinalis]|uniref:Transglutaminase domain-containing protein n=1 Tax=Protaetiibacter intestinalis TaxID=2419774 RepID=A0A387BBP0_9MICO|nr:DUF3488 and transglutaminase-like domain-containing protein [Protaetiibacter intestinalis]AYF98556.1 transglutaminase domain-containing protein [Protaetiibacter intestinalis]
MALTDTRRPSAAPAPARRRAPAPRRPPAPWSRFTLPLGALLTALAGLTAVLEGVTWWVVGAGFAAAVLLAARVARSLLRGRAWPPAVSLAVGVALLTLGYAADTALLGVIPTPGTFERWGAILRSGIASIVEQRVPASPELGIVMLIAMLMIASAWFSDVVVAAGRPALVAFPLGVILAIPMAVRAELTETFWFVLTAVLYLAILRIGRRRDSRRVTLLVGATALVGSLVAPFALPAVQEDSAPVAGVRTGVNPLVTLGDDLRRGDPVLALSYTTNATEPVYLRLTTLLNFTGDTWGPVFGDTGSGSDLGDFPDPPGLGATVSTQAVQVDVDVAQVLSRWLPVPYPAQRVDGVVGDWTWDADGLSVRSAGTSARGQEYTVDFLEVDPTLDQLERVAVPQGLAAQTLALPPQVPDIVTTTAFQATADAQGAYAQALALQSYLRSAPFAYSEDAPVEEGFDGSGMDALAAFLEKKVGYCVHYASAMAVMARVLGIPSRIAVGFQPGERVLVDGVAEYQVSSNDLHAWPELYFEGVGWLRFEPTPGRGSVPDYGEELVDDPTTPEDESSPTPLPTATTAPDARPDRDESGALPDEQTRQSSPAVAISLAVLAGVIALLAVPGAFRAVVRARRIRRMRRGPDPAAAAWEELRDTARDFGWSAPDSETPRAFAERLQPTLGEDVAALRALRGSVEVSAYGRPDAATVSVAELAEVRRAIARTHSLRTRLRVLALPPSLLARWRPDAE